MKKPSTWGVTVVVLLFLALNISRGETSAFDIPRLDRIAIDGDARDWGDYGFRVDLLPDMNGFIRPARDFDARFRLGWDDRGLLILIKTNASTFVEHPDPDRIWTKSCVMLMAGPRSGSSNCCLFCISPGRDPLQPELRWKAYDNRGAYKTPTPPTMTGARAKTEAGYVMEVLLPWGQFTTKQLPPSEIGFKLVVSDAASLEASHQKTYRAVWLSGGLLPRDRNLTCALHLVESTTPFGVVVAGGHPAGWKPRVEVAGPSTLAGQEVEVRQAGATLARGQMVLDEDRAFAELAWSQTPPEKAPGEVTVVLDGKRISTLNLPEAARPELMIVQTPPRSIKGDTGLSAQLNPSGDAYADAEVMLDIEAPGGQAVASVRGRCGKEWSFSLQDGLFRLRGAIPSLNLETTAACLVGENPREILERLIQEACALRGNPKCASSVGWIEYATSRIDAALGSGEIDRSTALETALCLAEWIEQTKSGKDALASLQGMVKWAYLSAADGTGQPFVLGIPEGYNPDEQYALTVYLHGRGGVLPQVGPSGSRYDESEFTLWVMARARGGGYVGLMETDVLEATQYVASHWNIDPDRVHIRGVSMGGGGTFWIASRHPDLFASASPVCGYGLQAPVENLLYVPTYALHSRDDFSVLVSTSRAPLRRLSELGGQAICDETDGAGHGVAAIYEEGALRAADWSKAQKRPKEVRRFRYTALDEAARGAYWARVTEWGPEGRPASFSVSLGEGVLCTTLDNVTTLEVRLADSPTDRESPLMLTVNNKLVHTFLPPLPERFYLTSGAERWRVSSEPSGLPTERLHFPGGAMALFHGEPIMVVWGTQGDDVVREAMFSAGMAARRSPTPAWPTTEELQKALPMSCTLYGKLPGKADTEVTSEDIARYNLLLIGTPEQNTVVARMAGKLPVRIASGRVTSSDGFSWGFKDRALGVLWHNPEAPRRLIYWVASESANFYRPGAELMQIQAHESAPDFILMGKDGLRVAARRFDSRWNWEEGYAESPLLPEECCLEKGISASFADALRREAGADLAFVTTDNEPDRRVWAAGETREMDVIAFAYDLHVAAFDLTGRQIEEYRTRVGPQPGNKGQFLATDRLTPLKQDRVYRIALMPWDIYGFVMPTRSNPESFRLLDCTIHEALRHHLAASWGTEN